MSAFLAFLGTFLLSLFVALLAALQLADYFGATRGVRAGPDGAAGFRDDLPAGVHRSQCRGAPAARVQRGGGVAWRCSPSSPLAFPALVKTAADRSTNPFSVGDREHRGRAGIHRSGAGRGAGAMGPGAAALAAAARRGRSQPLALDRDHGRRPGDPQPLRARHHRPGDQLSADQLAARRGAHHCARRRGRAARDGVPRILYPGPHAAPAAGASAGRGLRRSRYTRPGN